MNKDVMARLKKQSGSFKKKEIEEKKANDIETVEVTHVSPAPLLSEEYIEGNYDLTQDTKINSFLKIKAVEIKNVEAASRIELGRVLAEVFDNLSGSNQYDGLYEKWLEEVEINKRTALRHRKRYEVHSKINNPEGKQLVASLPERLMDKLYTHEELPLIIKKIEDGMEKKGLRDLVEEVTHVSPAMTVHEKPVVPFYKPVFTFERKISKMTEGDRVKARKEIKAIIEEARRLEKILGEN